MAGREWPEYAKGVLFDPPIACEETVVHLSLDRYNEARTAVNAMPEVKALMEAVERFIAARTDSNYFDTRSTLTALKAKLGE